MKPGKILILAFFLPNLSCYAQSKGPAARPAQAATLAPAGSPP